MRVEAGAEPSARGDFRRRDFALALGLALLVELGAAFAIRRSGLEHQAQAPEIEKGLARPVRVIPVVDLDAPLLKLGGGKAKLPDRWMKPRAKARVEERAFVSTKAEKTVEAIPREDVPLADPGTPLPPPDAELTKQVDSPQPTQPDESPAGVPGPGHVDGVQGGTETDPLKARAVDLYRARIAAWFSSRFRVSGSGLPQSELTRLRVRASVSIGDDRRVVSFEISPSGNAAFDEAARRTLQGTVGDTIPPPPQNYPDTVQNQISLTFVCKENRCD